MFGKNLMQIFGLLLVVISFLVNCKDADQNETKPEQVHLSLGNSLQQMVVTWTTLAPVVNASTVFYSTSAHLLNLVAQGVQSKFVDGGHQKRAIYIHRVYLNNLKAGTTYHYQVGSSDHRSRLFFFKTLPAEHNRWSPSVLVLGDLGATNGRSVGQMAKEVAQGRYDLALHVGDFAYDFHDQEGKVGDAFMRLIEPIAAALPYQVCVGNHEQRYNFSHYNARFSMHAQRDEPETTNNFFWSWNIGQAHVIAFSTEFHFFQQYGTQQIDNQYRWLEQDLKKANQPEMKAKHPWLITIGHRPMYGELPDVNQQDQIIRKGNSKFPGFEDLFYKYGVDIQLYGHIHNYERIWPIYNNTVYNGSLSEPYRNPKAPVHITTGSAGCPEKLTPKLKKRPPYSAFVLSDYGFTRMKILNSTHVHFQQTAESKNWEVADEFYVIKEKHGPEAWL